MDEKKKNMALALRGKMPEIIAFTQKYRRTAVVLAPMHFGTVPKIFVPALHPIDVDTTPGIKNADIYVPTAISGDKWRDDTVVAFRAAFTLRIATQRCMSCSARFEFEQPPEYDSHDNLVHGRLVAYRGIVQFYTFDGQPLRVETTKVVDLAVVKRQLERRYRKKVEYEMRHNSSIADPDAWVKEQVEWSLEQIESTLYQRVETGAMARAARKALGIGTVTFGQVKNGIWLAVPELNSKSADPMVRQIWQNAITSASAPVGPQQLPQTIDVPATVTNGSAQSPSPSPSSAADDAAQEPEIDDTDLPPDLGGHSDDDSDSEEAIANLFVNEDEEEGVPADPSRFAIEEFVSMDEDNQVNVLESMMKRANFKKQLAKPLAQFTKKERIAFFEHLDKLIDEAE